MPADSIHSESDFWNSLLGSYEDVKDNLCSRYEPGRLANQQWLDALKANMQEVLTNNDLSKFDLTPDGYNSAMAQHCSPISEAKTWELFLSQEEVRTYFCDIYEPLGNPNEEFLEDSSEFAIKAWGDLVNLGDLRFTVGGYHAAMQTHCPSVETISESDIWAMVFTGTGNTALLDWACVSLLESDAEISQELLDSIASDLAPYLSSSDGVKLSSDGLKNAVKMHCPVSQGAVPSRLVVTSEQEFWDIVFVPNTLAADTDLAMLFCEDTNVVPDAGWVSELERLYRDRFADEIDFGDHSLTIEGWIEAAKRHCTIK